MEQNFARLTDSRGPEVGAEYRSSSLTDQTRRNGDRNSTDSEYLDGGTIFTSQSLTSRQKFDYPLNPDREAAAGTLTRRIAEAIESTEQWTNNM